MWETGKGNGLVIALTVVLLVAWPLIPLALIAGFVWYVARPAGRWAWAHKITTATIVLGGLLVARLGVAGGLYTLAVLILTVALDAVLLRAFWPTEYERYVTAPLGRARRRRRLAATFPEIALAHGLGAVAQRPRRFGSGWRTVTMVPGQVKVTCGTNVDRIVARPVMGHTADTWTKACDGLAITYGAVECRAGLADRAHLFLDIVRYDALAGVVPAFPIPATVDLSAVPIGVREDGGRWTVRLEGNHLLVAGATGAGKGSVLWSILRGIGGPIRDGLVQVWAIDPKGGQELFIGRRLFHRYADDSMTDMVELLHDAVEAMEARSKRNKWRLRRKHRTTVAEPLVVIVIDELADLTTHPDRKMRDAAVAAINTLLRKGRSNGFVVVTAVQDPAKEIVAFRQLIPDRIALRLRESGQVKMILGEGAWEAGAYCDRIPHPGAEGTGYVLTPRTARPERVRACWQSDDDITELATSCPAPVNVDLEHHGYGNGPDPGNGGTPLSQLPSPTGGPDEWKDAA